MNIYRNRITGVIVEMASEFGNKEVWEKISPAPAAKTTVKAEPEEKPKTTKTQTTKKATTTKRTVKK